MREKVRQALTLVSIVATIAVNTLANTLPINGQNTGEISDRFEIFFVPAGYVFSIWGLIYLGLIIFAIYQALPGQRTSLLQQRIAPAVWLAGAANIAWVFLWHYELFPLTLAAMLIILAALIYIFVQISSERKSMDTAQRWIVETVFAVYLGWISVATVANVSQVLYFFDWNGWGITGEIWAMIMTAVAAVLGLLMLWREKSIAYALVLIWAFVGIALKHGAQVGLAAWIGSVVLTGAAVYTLLVRNKNVSEG